jgi:nicotinamide-nucleotide amidase
VIVSRTLRTWGLGESHLAELVAERLEALDAAPPGSPTIAFLASGIEGIKLRLTVKSPDEATATAALDAEEAELRRLVGHSLFSVDEPMEQVVGSMLVERSWHLATAESFTGGLLASRVVAVPGASNWFAGGLVPYASEVKHSLLGVDPSDVVSAAAAVAMAEAVRRMFGAEVGLSTTGVAGPDAQQGHPPGTVFVGLALAEAPPEAVELRLPGARDQVRGLGVISALDLLRRRMIGAGEPPTWATATAPAPGSEASGGATTPTA